MRYLLREGGGRDSDAVAQGLARSPVWRVPAFASDVIELLEQRGVLSRMLMGHGDLLARCLLEPRCTPAIDRALRGCDGDTLRGQMLNVLVTSWQSDDTGAFCHQYAQIEAWCTGIALDERVQALSRSLQRGGALLPLTRMLMGLVSPREEGITDRHHLLVFSGWTSEVAARTSGVALTDLTHQGWDPSRARRDGQDLLTHYATRQRATKEAEDHVRFLAAAGFGNLDEIKAAPQWQDVAMKEKTLMAVQSVHTARVARYLDEAATPRARPRPRPRL